MRISKLTGHHLVSYNHDAKWCLIYEGWILKNTYQKQVVYVAIANPTRRKLIRLLADVEELYDY